MTTCRACGRVDCSGDLCALCGAYFDSMGGGLPLSPRGERFPEIDGTDARSAALGRQPRDAAAPTGAADGDHGDDTPEPRPGDTEDFVRLSVHEIALLLRLVDESEAPGEVKIRLAARLMDAITPEEFAREMRR